MTTVFLMMKEVLEWAVAVALASCVAARASDEVPASASKKGIQLAPETRLRVVSYNAYWTSVFPKDDGSVRKSVWMDGKGFDSGARLARFAAWAPMACGDIWAMQEVIYSKEDQADTTAKGIGEYFQRITGQSWHAAADGQGRVVISRFPVLWSGAIRNSRGMAALIDLPASTGDDLLVVNLHFYTKPKAVQIKQATGALEFIRSVRRGERADIPKETAVMICGDSNSLPIERPYQILIKLDQEAEDGDGKSRHFHDTRPMQLHSQARGTYGEVMWLGEPGKSDRQPPTRTIDHVLTPKGFMAIHQAFLFNSLILPGDVLGDYGVAREAILLHREGNREMVDHLPVIVDLK